MDLTKDEKPTEPKNAQEPHEGFGDGDDDDPEDRLMRLQLHMSLTGAFMEACASARAHGMEFANIRTAFELQMTVLTTAEKSLAARISPDEAAQAFSSAAHKVAGLPDPTKKSS